MESLKESILKSVKAGRYTLFPKSKYELRLMIENEIREKGYDCDLNHIYLKDAYMFQYKNQLLNFLHNL